MEIKFIQANYKNKIQISTKIIDKLKTELQLEQKTNTKRKQQTISKKNKITIYLYTAVQFLKNIEHLKKQLEKEDITVFTSKPRRAKYKYQILGCDSYADSLNIKSGFKSNLNLDKQQNVDFDCFLYIGDGNFHPNAILFSQEMSQGKKIRPVFIYNPITKKLKKITIQNIQKNIKKRQGNILSFHMRNKIGVFISSKWGQSYEKAAMKLEKMYPEKNFYFFIGSNFSQNEIDNFNFIECWVNTACPRIGQDDIITITKPVVNIKDIWKK